MVSMASSSSAVVKSATNLRSGSMLRHVSVAYMYMYVIHVHVHVHVHVELSLGSRLGFCTLYTSAVSTASFCISVQVIVVSSYSVWDMYRVRAVYTCTSEGGA